MVVPTMDYLPRVPDTHGDQVDEKIYSDLYIRTSWYDAATALDQMEKGKARGRISAVYMRSVFQSHLYELGASVQKHPGKVLFVAILVLSTFCVGLKSATIHSKVHQLWIEEGGQLEEELAYTQKSLGETDSSTHQLLIQTPKDPDASVLHPAALLTHLDVVRQATSVTVHMFDTTWSLKDMCYSPNIPSFDVHYIEQIFENIIPCAIITPLDCFWEGSKLLGPDYPVHIPGLGSKVLWTSLNPQDLLKTMKSTKYQFPFDTLEQYMKRAAISTGYTEKPCLDPKDPQCPATAPNKHSQQPPDIGAELTGGCYGFAAKYMHWPEELVVGGVVRNRTRHLKKAKALQTVVQLMGEREMYEYWNENYKVHHVGWSVEKAAEVLSAWQKKFSAEVNKITRRAASMTATASTSYDIFAFSSAALDDILEKYSSPRPVSLVIGTAATLIYAAVILLRWRDPVHGQSGVGIAGVLLIGVSTAAGLGFCALLGIAFNAATTQVVPFLALGLGVDHVFLLAHAYSERNDHEETGQILKKTGLSVLLSAASTSGSFFSAVLIPVPALRVFCLQAAILLSFNLAAVLLVFPAMISLDLRRRRNGRADILCCCLPALINTPPHAGASIDANSVNARHHASHHHPFRMTTTGSGAGTTAPPLHNHTSGDNHATIAAAAATAASAALVGGGCHKKQRSFTLAHFASRNYAPIITKGIVKFVGMLTLAIVMGASVLTAAKLQDGLELTDLVPQNTDEYKFLSAQGRLFGFYSMFAVTQGDFEYPTNQRLLHDYHEAYVRVSHVIKNDNGGLPDFWLSLFRDWLLNLQRAFDRDHQTGCITQERWFANASDDAILAYKLLVQTGHVDNPIDKSLVSQSRLVDADGIINPKAFYNYLSAWAWNDAFAYGASQGNLRPEPRQWYHSPSDFELKIPKSTPLTYTQLPFYLHGLSDTMEIKTVILQIRELCTRFEERGLPNYPSGIPFIFWEQYMNLRYSVAMALGCALATAFCLVGILLLSFWAAFLVIFSVVTSLIQLLAVMSLLGIKLSAIPAVILTMSVGVGVCFTVHISLSFVTSIGNRDRRVRLALEQTMSPVVHSIMTTVLSVLMLSSSPFEFIVRHFLWLLLSVLLIGTVNGLFFFPILLSLIGPSAEVVPLEHANRISTPSPPPYRSARRPKSQSSSSSSSSKRGYTSCSARHYHHGHNGNGYYTHYQPGNQQSTLPQHYNSGGGYNQKHFSSAAAAAAAGAAINADQPSLTTITEEPQSWQSTASSTGSLAAGCYDMPSQQQQQQHPSQHPPQHPSQHQHQHQQQQHQQHSHQYQSSSTPVITSQPSAKNGGSGGGGHGDNSGGPELQSIVLQPEVTVETHHHGGDHQNTKVTATANIKVELVTPGRTRMYTTSTTTHSS